MPETVTGTVFPVDGQSTGGLGGDRHQIPSLRDESRRLVERDHTRARQLIEQYVSNRLGLSQEAVSRR